MPNQQIIDFMTMYGSFASLVMGGVSIALGFMFFLSAKSAERRTEVMLGQLSQTVSTLNEVSNGLVGKAMDHMADNTAQVVKEAFNNINTTKGSD